MTIKSKINFFPLIAAMLLLMSVFLHLYELGTLPPGFYCDEASIGYNAWSITLTGSDEYGNRYPLFFRCFDNYHEPVMVYSVALLVKLFGLSEFVVRLPSAFFLILASIAFYFLAKRYSRNRYLSLGAAFVFSVLPWIFPVSRVMMAGYTAMLLGLCLGWLFMMKAFGKRSYTYALISAAGWAFAMYSHNCGRPVTAVLLVGFTLCSWKILLRRWRIYSVFASSFFIFMVPMIVAVMFNPKILSGRFSQIALWNNSSGISETLHRLLSNYLSYFNPSFLFFRGDSNLRHHSGFGGELYLFLIPLMLCGIYCVCRRIRRNPWAAFILFGILLYPAAAIFTVDPAHATRSINGTPFWMALAVAGAVFLYRRKAFCRKLLFAVLLLGAFEISLYMIHYFSKYRDICGPAFSAPNNAVLKYVFSKMSGNDCLYVSPTFFPHAVDRSFKPVWYSYFLFFGRIDPAEYQKNSALPSRIIPYAGICPYPGYLIRSSSLTDSDGAVFPNFEKVPKNAVYFLRIRYKKNSYYEIYRIGDVK